MAKYRTIQALYWADDYIYKLTSNGKLLYTFLLTNSFIDNLGVASLPEDVIVLFTKIQPDEVEQLLAMFESDKKIVRDGGSILVANFIKHQTNNIEKNFKVVKGLQDEYTKLKAGKLRDILQEKYASIFSTNEAPYMPHISPLQAPPTIEKEIEKEREREREKERETTTNPPNPDGEQLTLTGNTETEKPFTCAEFLELWNSWITKHELPNPKAMKINPEREKAFKARQKEFAAEGAYGKKFWKQLLTVALTYSNGLYIGNGKPNTEAGYNNPYTLKVDELLKNNIKITALFEAVEPQSGITIQTENQSNGGTV